MRIPTVNKFGGGLNTDNANTGGWNDFALLIDANSATNHIQKGASAYNDGVGQGSSVHDAIYRITAQQLSDAGGTGVAGDMLNGADIVGTTDADGVPMLAYSDNSLPDVWDKWILGSGFASYGDRNPFFVTEPNTSFTTGTGSPFVDTDATECFVMWICAFLPAGFDTALVKRVGFDIGGANDSTNGTDGAVAAFLGDTGGYQFTALNVRSPFDGAYGLYTALGIGQNDKRVTMCLAVNGTNPSFGCQALGAGQPIQAISGGAAIGNATGGTKWTTGAVSRNVMINLGEGMPAGFGIYSMGIKNYGSTSIPQVEVDRVCNFLSTTGRLPYWWQK